MPADRHPGLPPDTPSPPDTPPAPALRDLPPDRQRAAAQDMARAEPDLTGKALAARFGRQERWGREQLAAARTNGTGTRHAAPPPARHNGTPTNGTASGTPTSGTPRHFPTGTHSTPHDDQPAAARNNGTGTRHAAPPPGRHTGTPAADGSATAGRTPTADGGGTTDGPPDAPYRGPARAGTDPEPAVPRSLVVLTVVAVAIVAAVTMVTSYTHTHDLAVMAGWGWLATILPAAVDGLVVAGSTSLMVDRRLRGRTYPGHPLAWAAVAIGLASSMAANIVAVDPSLVDMRVVRWVMAGYAPVALAISGHLLLRMLGEQR